VSTSGKRIGGETVEHQLRSKAIEASALGGAESVVKDLVAAWNERDLPRVLSHLTDDVIWDDPALSEPAKGRDEVRRFCEALLRAFPDFRYEVRYPICVAEDSTKCAVPFTITATNLGSLDPPGYGPSGRRVKFDGLDLLEFDNGAISRITTYFNVTAVAGELLEMNIRPPAGSIGERLLVWIQRVRAGWVRWRSRSSREGGNRC